MPNYLYVNDPTPNDGIRHAYAINSYMNYDGIIVGTGVDVSASGGWIDGNNLSGSIGLTLAGNATLTGSLLVTNFDMGIFGSGNANHIIGSSRGSIEVESVRNVGVGVSGGATVMNVEVHYVESTSGNAFGFVGWGGNNRFWYDDVSNINGKNETVGLSMGYGGDVYDFNATGSAGQTGWSFGFWAGGGGNYTVSESSFTDFDNGIANVGGLTIDHSTVTGRLAAIVASYTNNGNNTITTDAPQSGTITGTSGINHLVGDSGASDFFGSGGRDVMYGQGGADTFHFIDDGERVILPDYNEAQGDSIDLGDFDPLASFTFNGTTHEFLYNGNAIAYIPGANSINDITYFF